jgi:hypothetical protein
MRAIVLVSLAACGSHGAEEPPSPWTSGTKLMAEVFTDDKGLLALAGRWDPEILLSCAVDDLAAPKLANCPPAGTTVTRSYEGVDYVVEEAEDGFSIIQDVTLGNAVVDSRGGRIRARWQENNTVRAYRGLYDKMLGAPCRSVKTRAGRFFCAPESTGPNVGAGTYRTACGINVGHSIDGSSIAGESRVSWTVDAAGRQVGDFVLRCGPEMVTVQRVVDNVCETFSVYACSNRPLELMGWAELALSLDESARD